MQVTKANIEMLSNEIKEALGGLSLDDRKSFIVLKNGCTLVRVSAPRINGYYLFINSYPVAVIENQQFTEINAESLAMQIEKEIRTLIEETTRHHARLLLQEFNMGEGNQRAFGIEIRTAILGETGIKACTLSYKGKDLFKIPYTSVNKNLITSSLIGQFNDIIMEGCFSGEFICTIQWDEITIKNPQR